MSPARELHRRETGVGKKITHRLHAQIGVEQDVASALGDALAAGTPVVTLPGGALRGRFAQGALRLLGLDECIAQSAEDYVERAVSIAGDADRRRALSLRIDERAPALFGDKIAIDAIAELLECCQRVRN